MLLFSESEQLILLVYWNVQLLPQIPLILGIYSNNKLHNLLWAFYYGRDQIKIIIIITDFIEALHFH